MAFGQVFGMAFGRILLCFVLPAIFTLNMTAKESAEECLPWLRYWVVLSIALIADLLLLRWNSMDGAHFTVAKLVFVIWCLAPVEWNGSYVIFQYVLLPLHASIGSCLTETSAIGLKIVFRCEASL